MLRRRCRCCFCYFYVRISQHSPQSVGLVWDGTCLHLTFKNTSPLDCNKCKPSASVCRYEALERCWPKGPSNWISRHWRLLNLGISVRLVGLWHQPDRRVSVGASILALPKAYMHRRTLHRRYNAQIASGVSIRTLNFRWGYSVRVVFIFSYFLGLPLVPADFSLRLTWLLGSLGCYAPEFFSEISVFFILLLNMSQQISLHSGFCNYFQNKIYTIFSNARASLSLGFVASWECRVCARFSILPAFPRQTYFLADSFCCNAA